MIPLCKFFKVLDLMPPKIFPHDVYSFEVLESAYKIKAISQAHQILEEYTKQCFEEIQFFYAMPLWQFSLTQTENSIAQQTIKQLADLAGKYGDVEIKDSLENELKRAMGK